MASTLRIDVLTTPEALARVGEEWNALVRRAKVDLPFMRHEWMVVWWRHFAKSTLALRDSLWVMTVRTPAPDNALVGILPFMRSERPAQGPLRVRTLSFLGADPYITEVRLPVFDPAHEADVAHAVVEHLRNVDGWDWVQWPGMVRGSIFAAAIERAAGLKWADTLPSYVVPLAKTWDAFRGTLKRNVKESLRHCYNSLKRDGHTMRLTVARTPDEIAAALPLFFDLHTRRADLSDTVKHPNRFPTGAAQDFLRDVMGELSRAGDARVYTLLVNDKPVACRIGFVCDKTLYLYYSGYDPAWSKYSVMTTVVAEAIKLAIEEGFEAVHLSTGLDVSKTRWGPRETVYSDAFQVRPGLRPWLAREGFLLARDASKNPKLARIARLLPARSMQ